MICRTPFCISSCLILSSRWRRGRCHPRSLEAIPGSIRCSWMLARFRLQYRRQTACSSWSGSSSAVILLTAEALLGIDDGSRASLVLLWGDKNRPGLKNGPHALNCDVLPCCLTLSLVLWFDQQLLKSDVGLAVDPLAFYCKFVA